jgi:hypothetical protein
MLNVAQGFRILVPMVKHKLHFVPYSRIFFSLVERTTGFETECIINNNINTNHNV